MNKNYYSKKAESALAWSITWLVSAVVCAFLAVVYLKGDAEWVKGYLAALGAILSAIGCYSQGLEASRCQRIHLSRQTVIDSTKSPTL